MCSLPQFTAIRSRSVEIGADSSLGISRVGESVPFGGNPEEAQEAGDCSEHRSRVCMCCTLSSLEPVLPRGATSWTPWALSLPWCSSCSQTMPLSFPNASPILLSTACVVWLLEGSSVCSVQHLSPIGRQGVHAPASLLRSVEIMTRFFIDVHSEKSAVKILSKMKNSVQQNNYFCKAFQILPMMRKTAGAHKGNIFYWCQGIIASVLELQGHVNGWDSETLHYYGKILPLNKREKNIEVLQESYFYDYMGDVETCCCWSGSWIILLVLPLMLFNYSSAIALLKKIKKKKR